MISVDMVPRALETMENAAHRLHITPRQLQKLAHDTPLATVQTIALGRALGTYRLWPSVGIALLRQRSSGDSWHSGEWSAAIGDIIGSTPWQQALNCLLAVPAAHEAGSSAQDRLNRLLVSAELYTVMGNLFRESLKALRRYDLDALIDIDTMIVDRIEDEEDAVILLGEDQHPYTLPTAILRTAGLAREKAHGFLMATHTGGGIALDAWPAMAGDQEWRPDLALWRHAVDVGA